MSANLCKQCMSLIVPPLIFCGRSCSASFHNSGRIKVERERRSCISCGILFVALSSSAKVYCKQGCNRRLVRKLNIDAWLSGKRIYSGAYVPEFIKIYLFEKQNGCCQDCGFADWNGGLIPLQLEHKDGDHTNNDPENVCLVCPNCHALKPTSGSRNKGRGREGRLKYSNRDNATIRSAVLKIHAAVAQLEEHTPGTGEVVDSSSTRSSTLKK